MIVVGSLTRHLHRNFDEAIFGTVFSGNDPPASGGLRRQVLLQTPNGFLRDGDNEISVSSFGKHGPVILSKAELVCCVIFSIEESYILESIRC